MTNPIPTPQRAASTFPREEAGIVLLVFGAAWSATDLATPAASLLAGVALGLSLGNALAPVTSALSKTILKASVVLLGFGIPLAAVLSAGASGFLQISVAVALVGGTGLLVGRILGVEWTTSWLVTIGTAICGGSAIAALGPTIRARAESMSVALATVFVLNAVALYAFPPVGAWAGLSQHEFGQWTAMAIHDTASVVGAASMYGPEALEEATVLKLVRTLWIVPLVGVAALWISRRNAEGPGETAGRRALKAFPWFVFAFLAAAALRGAFPNAGTFFEDLRAFGRQGLVVALFLIGACLNREGLRRVGATPLLQGTVLWVLVSAISLLYVRS